MSKPKVTLAPPGPQAPAPPLEQIPVSHHAVTCALSRAEAALDLLRLAEEQYEDGADALEFARDMCLGAISDELARAKGAYVKAVGDKTASATETAR